MKYLAILFTILVSASFTTVSAIQTSQTPAPIDVGKPPTTSNIYGTPDYELSKRRVLPTEESLRQARENKLYITKYVDPIYRDPTEAELRSVAVDPAVRSLFAAFLSQPHSGIFKITPDLGCDDPMTTGPTSAECSQFPLPGAGNSFSFRLPNYRMRSLADLTFSGAKFYATGALTQGILVKLGDVPIEGVGLRSKGVAYLAAYQPSSDIRQISEAAKRFEAGLDSDGFQYANRAPVEMNVTYALRSIAYRGEVVRSFQGAIFNELDYDKRSDVTVVFRTVGFDRSGTLTIIWRELKNSESPKVKK